MQRGLLDLGPTENPNQMLRHVRALQGASLIVRRPQADESQVTRFGVCFRWRHLQARFHLFVSLARSEMRVSGPPRRPDLGAGKEGSSCPSPSHKVAQERE